MAANIDSTPLVVIVGETASGKSALALGLATQFGGEIIAADAWTVYEGFNIGTAKPSTEEQGVVPHHLLDIADARDGFSAAVFKRQAEQAIADIAERRGKLPMLVGGSGLYIDSVLYDYEFLPAPSPQERQRLNAMSILELLNEAQHRDIDTSTIDIRNKRRIIRLLENEGIMPKRSELRANTLVIGMALPQETLAQRIRQRVDAMFTGGLEAEVRELAERYGWDAEPMKGIGYREFREYFDGKQTLEQTKERIVAGTMRLAKKQRTWFRRNKSIHWVHEQTEAVELLTSFLNKYHI